jgi:hypothetical protein
MAKCQVGEIGRFETPLSITNDKLAAIQKIYFQRMRVGKVKLSLMAFGKKNRV